jgi:hypothetical protein
MPIPGDRPAADAAQRRSMNLDRDLRLFTVVSLASIAILIGLGLVMPPTNDIHGIVRLPIAGGHAVVRADGSCAGANRFSDVQRGAAIDLRDGHSNVIARSTLGGGHAAGLSGDQGCDFEFVFRTVPDVSDAYSVAVAGHETTPISRVDVDAMHWQLSLTLVQGSTTSAPSLGE